MVNSHFTGPQMSTQPAPSVSMESADKESITMLAVIIIIISSSRSSRRSTMRKILIVFTMFALPLGVGEPSLTKDVQCSPHGEETSSFSAAI